MPNYAKRYQTVDEYVADYPVEIAQRLKQIRRAIKQAVPPRTQEVISYNIPSYKFNGKGRAIIFFAAYPHHIAIYPIRPERTNFAKGLKPYHSGTATLKFPNDKPLPTSVIEKVIEYLVNTNT